MKIETGSIIIHDTTIDYLNLSIKNFKFLKMEVENISKDNRNQVCLLIPIRLYGTIRNLDINMSIETKEIEKGIKLTCLISPVKIFLISLIMGSVSSLIFLISASILFYCSSVFFITILFFTIFNISINSKTKKMLSELKKTTFNSKL